MRNILKGNDIAFLWSIYTGRGRTRKPFILEGIPLVVTITDAFGNDYHPKFDVKENTVKFPFYGKDQENLGAYTLTLEGNKDEIGMLTIKKVHPFRLVEKQNNIISGCDCDCKSCHDKCDCPDLELVVLDLYSDLDNVYDYDTLINKPKINHITLDGDKSAEELGLQRSLPLSVVDGKLCVTYEKE